MARLRVYLSSTFEDLKDYRAAVFAGLERAGLDVARMENYTAFDDRPLDLCLRDVAQSDIYVGLFAWRYGYEPPIEHGNPQGKSITELEYRHAESRKLRKLLFFAHPDTKPSWPDRFKDDATGEGRQGRKLDALRREFGTEKVASFFRTPDELATLVLAAILRTGLHGTYSIPKPPPGFVPRPGLTRALVESLAGGEAKHTLVQGAGGFGKTSLAVDACHRAEIVNAFPDGMLWVSLGQNPDLATKLGDLYLEVMGNRCVAVGVDAIGQALAGALEGRRCLLLVDDVWRAEDLEPFLRVEGPKLLVTTRIRNLIDQTGRTGWAEVPVDEMGTDEATSLLGRGLDPDDVIKKDLSSLADRLGCWALLLDLANARILEEHRTRASLADCVQRVAALFERRGVLGFDRRDSRARNAAAARSVEAGLEFAEEAIAGLSGKAVEISIFPEDVPTPVRVLADLWAMDEFDVEEEVVRPLDNLSLLKWERSTNEVLLHDMVRAALEARLVDAAPVHARLIDAWQDPHALPHDYAWRWFGWHCVRAGRTTRLRQLLLDFRWMQKKLEATDITALAGEFDYDHVRDEPSAALMQQVLRAAAHVLAERPVELASQLLARVPVANRTDLQELFAQIAADGPPRSLRPLTASLAEPVLLRVLRSKSDVRAVAITDDAKRIITVHGDGLHTVWQVDKGIPLRTVQWGRSGRSLVSIGVAGPSVAVTTFRQKLTEFIDDDDSRLIDAVTWDIESGQCLEWNKAQPLSEFPSLVITSGRDGAYETSTPLSLVVEDESERVVWRSPVSSSGSPWIAITERPYRWSGGAQRSYSAYVGLADGTSHIAVRFSDVWIGAAAIIPATRRLIASSFPSGTRIWDIESGEQVGIIPGPVLSAIAGDRGDEFVATSEYDGLVRIWKFDSLLASQRDAMRHTREVQDAQVANGDALAFTVSVDGTAITWDLETGSAIARIEPEVSSALSPDWFVRYAKIDVETGRVQFLVYDTDFPNSAGDISSYALASGASAPEPLPQTLDSYRDLLFTRPPLDFGASVASSSMKPLCISPDGARGVTKAEGLTVWVWDLSAGTKIASFGMDSEPLCCSCTARAETIVVGDKSGRVHILRLEDHGPEDRS